MSVSAVARLSARCLRASAVSPSRVRVPAGLRVDLQPMGTWTDKLKRWQSGIQSKRGEKKKAAAKKEATPPQEGATPSQEEATPPSDEPAEVSGGDTTAKEDNLLEKEKIKQLKDKYMRALAETENVRHRMRKQVEEAKLFGIQGFSKDIIDVADLLEKATESVPETELKTKEANPHLLSLFEGLKMTSTELQKAFSKNGLKKINPMGASFDPEFHEAMFEVPGEKPGTVAVVSRVGYVLHGRTVRPARVGVVKTDT